MKRSEYFHMTLFEISQKIPYEWVDDELLDTDSIVLGYVEDEFFAQEFCEEHKDCSYGPVIPTKYPLYLEARMITSKDDVGLLKVPYNRAYYDED